MKKENILQAEAFLACSCKDELAMIERHAAIFRNVIESWKANFHRLPSVDELLWCSSEIEHHDIRSEA